MPSHAESSNLITAILEARPSTAADERVLEASRRRGRRRSAAQGRRRQGCQDEKDAESAGGQTSRVLLSRTVEVWNRGTSGRKQVCCCDYLRGHASAIGVGAAQRALYNPPAPNFSRIFTRSSAVLRDFPRRGRGGGVWWRAVMPSSAGSCFSSPIAACPNSPSWRFEAEW
jgi:hypothetical protein